MASISYAASFNELELVNRCKANDEQAYFEFFNRYSKKIFKLAYRILGQEPEAEDALQETFLNIFIGMQDFRGDATLSTWITRITINVCLGIIRKNKRQEKAIDRGTALDAIEGLSMHLPAHDMPAHFNPYANALAEETEDRVHAVLDRLGERHKLVVKLHDLDGLTIEEIAKILRCPSGTVKSRLFYGRKEFKDAYDQLYTIK